MSSTFTTTQQAQLSLHTLTPLDYSLDLVLDYLRQQFRLLHWLLVITPQKLLPELTL
jgi:hypothetical protein